MKTLKKLARWLSKFSEFFNAEHINAAFKHFVQIQPKQRWIWIRNHKRWQALLQRSLSDTHLL